MYFGIEIGGTKLQLALGQGDGNLTALWRGAVDASRGSEGIRQQIIAAVPKLLEQAGVDHGALRCAGIGFGGPTDDATRTVIKSHHIQGWDGFPLADWVSELLGGIPTVLANDADVAGLGEALFGAGKGLSPAFYVTVGTGIGGGLIIDGEIYRGVGKGAAEIGHLRVGRDDEILEYYAAGWGIAEAARRSLSNSAILAVAGNRDSITAYHVGQALRAGDRIAQGIMGNALDALSTGICHVIALLCPRVVVIGGGISLLGEELFFAPLRERIARRVFSPFAGLTDIVPAALGEEVVLHGALALAHQRFGRG